MNNIFNQNQELFVLHALRCKLHLYIVNQIFDLGAKGLVEPTGGVGLHLQVFGLDLLLELGAIGIALEKHKKGKQ